MYEVGDLVRLDVTNRDSDGNPVDAGGAVAVAVTQPDGTAYAPTLTVSHAAPGLYWADFPAAQAGRHLVRWTAGVGAARFAFADVLNVWPADPRFLLSLDDARRALGRSGRSAQDDDLRLFMAAVTPVIEDIVGPILSRAVTQYFDGGGDSVLLANPVEAGTAVTVVESGFPSTSFYVNYESGIVHASNYGNVATPRAFAPGRQNVVVTYTTGGQAVTANVVLAAREELRFLWENAQGSHHGDEDDSADVAYTQSGYAVPATVLQMLTSTPRFGGFA